MYDIDILIICLKKFEIIKLTYEVSNVPMAVRLCFNQFEIQNDQPSESESDSHSLAGCEKNARCTITPSTTIPECSVRSFLKTVGDGISGPWTGRDHS